MSSGLEDRLGGARLEVAADEEAAADQSARLTVETLSAAIAERGTAHVALTGGSSAISLYRALVAAEYRAALDWKRVHLWWGDERFVPIDHPESNAGLAYRVLLAVAELSGESGYGGQYDDDAAGDVRGVLVDPDKVHPVDVDGTLGDDQPVELAAQVYARSIERFVPLVHGGLPRFDLLMTGIGPDGHILSLFPGSPGLAPDAPITLAVPAPTHVEPHLPRVTLSARVLAPARRVLVMASGPAKAAIIGQVLGPERDPLRWPAQATLLSNAVWILDAAAANEIGS